MWMSVFPNCKNWKDKNIYWFLFQLDMFKWNMYFLTKSVIMTMTFKRHSS